MPAPYPAPAPPQLDSHRLRAVGLLLLALTLAEGTTSHSALATDDAAVSERSEAPQPVVSPQILDSRSGATLTPAEAAIRLQQADVIFLGEEHNSTPGHRVQLALIEQLHRLRPNLVVSLEMFERDVQGTLRDYLQGHIDETEFLARSRPWSNYRVDYRPIVEFASQHRLEVVASNIPRRIASAIARGEAAAPEDNCYLPRHTTAPDDAYAARFRAVMQQHGGTLEADKLERYYQAQCLKDDCMAESIAAAFASRRHRWPLVVHLCGRFHSDLGYGTVQRLQSRMPLLNTLVVSMEAIEPSALQQLDPESDELRDARSRCHLLVVVPEEKKEKKDDSPRQPAVAPRPQ